MGIHRFFFLDKLINWYFKKDSLPYWTIFILDSLLFYLAGIIIFWALFRYGTASAHFDEILVTITFYLVPTAIAFKFFHTYDGILRYSSFVDLQKVGYAMLAAFGIAVVIHYPIFLWDDDPYLLHVSTRHLVILYLTATILMWGLRIFIKTLYDIVFSNRNAMNVLIYGTKSGGIGLAKNIRSEHPVRFVLQGFITTNKAIVGHSLMGKKIFLDNENLTEVIEKKQIKGVLISPLRNNDFRSNSKLQDMLIEAGVKIYMVEGAKEWTGEDEFSPSQLHEVSAEDLLPREEIKVDMMSIGRQLAGKRILITGSAGSIGSEMVRQIAPYKPSAMMLIDQAETPQHDIRLMMAKRWPDIPCETVVTSIYKEQRMEDIFAAFRPDYVFHAAAYKHVPMMENNPSEAIQNNVYGTKVLADLAVKYGVKKFVMVSTDKAVNPTNVMGCSKRICEIYVQALNNQKRANGCQFVTTRFGNVLGSNGSVIPLFQEQIKRGGPVTVTHPDIIRFFMLIPEACKLVLEAGTKGNGGEIFVFDMGKPVRIADLAARMIKLSGAKGVKIKYTGLRAGEKLYEEVLNEQENTKPSFHEKIRIANVRQYDYETVAQEIDELIKISQRYDDMATVKKMKEIVPEYKSNNSIYEQLDKEINNEQCTMSNVQ